MIDLQTNRQQACVGPGRCCPGLGCVSSQRSLIRAISTLIWFQVCCFGPRIPVEEPMLVCTTGWDDDLFGCHLRAWLHGHKTYATPSWWCVCRQCHRHARCGPWLAICGWQGQRSDGPGRKGCLGQVRTPLVLFLGGFFLLQTACPSLMLMPLLLALHCGAQHTGSS